ncbi:tRNA (guanosine(46)-N7)-methyltransferase TrmB [Gammaproteobacteria bacterium]|nr:tRNA (guanosine(46)-N7)-methyltransferase TrmB [Gammaproteobacteria bacterium]
MESLHHFHLTDREQLLSLVSGYSKAILEIGFGNGENTSYLAEKNPEALIVASEVYRSGIGSLLASIAKHSFQNIKIFDDDIRELLLGLAQPIFHEIYIICPDPWPKARHHKRRLVDSNFLNALHQVMHPNGTIYISTDWEHYAEFIDEESQKLNAKFSTAKISNEGMPITRFQHRAIREGRNIKTFLLTSLKK